MPLRIGTELPSLDAASEWVNGPLSPEALAGKPVFVHFWSISCIICKEKMPAVQKLRDEFAPQGLTVVAVHMPLKETDLDTERAKSLAVELGITEPLAIDSTHGIAEAFQNTFVPAYFLFDAEHKMRGRSGGMNGLGLIRSSFERVFNVTT